MMSEGNVSLLWHAAPFPHDRVGYMVPRSVYPSSGVTSETRHKMTGAVMPNGCRRYVAYSGRCRDGLGCGKVIVWDWREGAGHILTTENVVTELCGRNGVPVNSQHLAISGSGHVQREIHEIS